MSRVTKTMILTNIVCCIVVLFTSLGYSKYSKKMTTDEILATVRIEKEIRVNNIVLSSTSGDATSSWEEHNHDYIEGRVILPTETSEIIYTVDILNLSEKEYGILSITSTSEILDFELLDYTLEEKICEGSKCSKGVTKPIKIKVKYKDGKFDSTQVEHSFDLNFDFRTYHKINYVDVPATGLPTEIIDGGVYNQTIAPEFSKDIEVKCGELVLTKDVDYTYNDNNLIINKTTDNLTITNIKYQIGDYVKLDTEGFYVISKDENTNTLTMLAEWNLNVGNNTIADAPEGMQNEVCKAWTSAAYDAGETYYCTIAFSTTNYWSSSVSTYPAWVYNENNDIIYPYVENYVTKLKEAGYSSVTGRLIKQEELISLGCPNTTTGTCTGPSWLSNTSYWSGSSLSSTRVRDINTGGCFDHSDYSQNNYVGVRPVITISASEIQ